jgi:hypothetical protein
MICTFSRRGKRMEQLYDFKELEQKVKIGNVRQIRADT